MNSEEKVRKILGDLGFDPVGFAPPEQLTTERAEYAEWLRRGHHGGMSYLEAHADAKFDPRLLLDGVATVVMVALGYFQRADGISAGGDHHGDRTEQRRPDKHYGRGDKPDSAHERSPSTDTAATAHANESNQSAYEGQSTHEASQILDPNHSAHANPTWVAESPSVVSRAHEESGRVSLYAWGRDYHKVMGAKLRQAIRLLESKYPGERFRSFVDVLPIAERHYAERAGIGFIGRNTLLITRRYGSWVFLGGLLTTLQLEPSSIAATEEMRCPSGCTRCIDACPTDALYASHRIDATKCISYLTIERKSGLGSEAEKAVSEAENAGAGTEAKAEPETETDAKAEATAEAASEAEVESRAEAESNAEAQAEKRSADWLFGCDVCQQVCPFNVNPRETGEGAFRRWIAGPRLGLDSLEDATRSKDSFVGRFAGSALMRAGQRGMKRNADVVRSNARVQFDSNP